MESFKSCVTVNGFPYDNFTIKVGLMQGEILSPILINMYVIDFEMHFLSTGCVPNNYEELNLFLLLYANDIALFF